MTDISSFLKLSPRETVLENWEVVDDQGAPTIGEAILGVLLVVASYFVLSFLVSQGFRVLGIWRLLWMSGLGSLRYLFTLLEVGLPAAFIGWKLLTRPRIQGQLCLTNLRLLYFAHGQNQFHTIYTLNAANLEDVLGIHTFYTEGMFGNKSLRLQIHTRFKDGIAIEAGETGSFLTKIPLLGKWMLRNTLGKDAFAMLPILFTRVRQHRGAAVQSSLTY